jgi:TonB-linked SusC/RagA family outer membrane protein
MKRILLLCLTAMLTLVSASLWAQDRAVSGKVTSVEDGSPLPGVNVVLKGTTSGTVTDSDGNYRLTVPQDGGTLVFTFIGLQSQEVAVGTRSTVDLQMTADVQQLSEVIVTAQGIEKTKNELGYAAQKVSGEDLSKARDVNFINSLSGKVAGVQITKNNSMGGSTNIIIRGYKSLTNNNQPLFVVDGVPIDNSNNNTTVAGGGPANQNTGGGGYDYGNSAADINPDDIETLNVLKGAAATALYGSRASNGVVFITTKKGKKGFGISINSGVTVGKVDKSTLPSYQKEYGAGYGQYYGPNGDAFFDQADINGDGVDDLVTPTYEDASQGGKFDPSLMVYQWDAFDPASPNYGKPRPWVAAAHDPSEFFETPVSTNNNIAVDGGNDQFFYKLNYTRNIDKGIMPNSRLQKDFVNFSAQFKISPRLTSSAALNFSNIDGKGRYGTGYDGASGRNVMTSLRQWWEMNVDITEQKDAYFRNNKNVTWNWAGPPSNLKPIYWDNPYWVRYQNFSTDNRARYFGFAKLDYKITDWLSAMGRVSLDSYNERQDERIAVGSVGVSNYTRFNREFREYNYDGMLNFNKDLTDDINLKAVLGTNIRRTKIQSIRASTNGGLVVPGLYALSNTKNPLNPPTELYSDIAVDGYYANATAGFRKLVFVDLAYRMDRSSSLPKGNNSYGYGSAATSFVFSELVGPSPWLTLGKIRLNYAEVGNTAPFNSLVDIYDKPTAYGSVPLFSIPGTKNNPALVPERTKNVEAGLEMSFLDGRVGFDASYYKSNTTDQLIPITISTATGYNSKYINAGNVQNSGIELTVFGVPVKTDDITWNINVNWTRNRNKVVEIYKDALGNDLKNLQLGAFQGGVTTNGALGQPYGTLRGKDFVYNDNGQKVVGPDGYYQITTASNNVIGNINPNWIAGIQNTVTYKNLALSFLIDIKNGGDIFSVDMYYGLATGLYKETAGLNENGVPLRNPVAEGGGILVKGVKEDGTPNDVRVEGNYDAQGYVRNPNSAFVYDASYVKLREVALTYSLPSSIVSKIAPFKGVDFSLIGRNLWIIHKNIPYSDPEDALSSGNAQGVQVGSLPNVKTTGFNIKLRF